MATDISEAGLEKIISDYLVDVNGYELGGLLSSVRSMRSMKGEYYGSCKPHSPKR